MRRWDRSPGSLSLREQPRTDLGEVGLFQVRRAPAARLRNRMGRGQELGDGACL